MNNLERLEETPCPCCGDKRLRLKETGDYWPEFPEYYVGCDNCDYDYWDCKSTDCGDSLWMFFDHLKTLTQKENRDKIKVKINRKKADVMGETEARKAWQKENTVHLGIKLQRSTDADILQYLEGKKPQTEIKKALRLLIQTENEKSPG